MPKPYGRLRRADLHDAPIWTWHDAAPGDPEDDTLDESFVQPTAHAVIPRVPFAQFIVSATIGLHSGATMPGIAEVTMANGAVAIQPAVVLFLDKHLQIPAVETNRMLSRYTQTLENHPVSWALDVLVDGETERRSGRIAGADMKDIVAAGMAILESLKSLRG